MRALLLCLLFLPLLAGCAAPPAPAPRLSGFDATFSGPAGTLHLRLAAGPDVADRFGAVRPAHALHLLWHGADGSATNDTLRLDGVGTPVRLDMGCLAGDCAHTRADWTVLGMLPPLGLWLPGHGEAEYSVEGVRLRQDLAPRPDAGLLRVDVLSDSRYFQSRYLAMPGNYWYDAADAQVPVRMSTVLSLDGRLVALDRTALRMEGPLPDIAPWPMPPPPRAPLPRDAALPEPAPFPDSPWPRPRDALAALPRSDCLLRFSQQRTPGDRGNATSTTVLLRNATGALNDHRLDATLQLQRVTPLDEPWASCDSGPWPPPPRVSLRSFGAAAAAAPVSANGSVNGWTLLRVLSGTHGPATPQRSLEMLIAAFTPASVRLDGATVAFAPYLLYADRTDGSWLAAAVHPADLARMDHGGLPRLPLDNKA
jgi:hypothetical protein